MNEHHGVPVRELFEEAADVRRHEGRHINAATVSRNRDDVTEQLIAFHEVWGKPEQAVEWRAKLPDAN